MRHNRRRLSDLVECGCGVLLLLASAAQHEGVVHRHDEAEQGEHHDDHSQVEVGTALAVNLAEHGLPGDGANVAAGADDAGHGANVAAVDSRDEAVGGAL